jgi:flagellar basal body rod protein FlgG
MTRTTRRNAWILLLTVPFTAIGCQSAAQPGPWATAQVLPTLPDAQLDARTAAAIPLPDRATGEMIGALKGIEDAEVIVRQNLANAESTAYKASRARWGNGAKVSRQLDLTQGSLENTGRPLDVGIQGQGFFAVKIRDSSVGYSRNGNFVVNKNGELVLNVGDGHKLVPPISIPPTATDITFGIDGTISVLVPGQTAKQAAGSLRLTQFISPDSLQPHGGILFETEASGAPTCYTPGQGGTGQILQGFLEASNVDKIRESARLRFLDQWRAALLHAAGERENPDTRTLDAALQTPERESGDLVDALEGVSVARAVVEHNISNAKAIAFKGSYATFADRGRISCTRLDLTQGSLDNTGRPLDVGIQGQGFFQVKILNSVGNGLGYTRNGNFVVNKNDELVLNVGDGYKLVPPIVIPHNAEHITIGIDGTISVLLAGQSSKQTVGQMRLFRFINPEGLQLCSANIFTETEESGPPTEYAPGDGGAGQLLQEFLEQSNVDVHRETARLRVLDKWRADLLRAAGVGD